VLPWPTAGNRHSLSRSRVPGHRRGVWRRVLRDGGACAAGRRPAADIDRNEEDTFYIVEGQCGIRLGEDTVLPGAGDFVNVPPSIVHWFHNEGTEAMRMILPFTPAGMERFFEETLQPVIDATQNPPEKIDAIVARYVEAAPRHGLEFMADASSNRS
jgi:mannose-6-phosphate isomerase-like protein (cupin superfamily)